MKLLHHLAILLLGFALVASCSDDDYHVTPQLTVSTNSLDFTKTSEEKSLTVTINKTDEFQYSVSSPSGIDWIKVTKAGDGQLKVAVLDNPTFNSREAVIKVLLLKGSLTENISVTQTAEDTPVMELSEGDMQLNHAAHKSVVYITKNVDTPWSVDTPDDWITITPELTKDLFTLDISANTTTEQKTGVVTVTCGEVIKKLIITQDGTIYFDLPYLGFGFTFRGPVFGLKDWLSLVKASEFENARGTKFVMSFGGFAHMYKTKSLVLPNLTYSTEQGSKNITFAAFSNVKPAIFTDGRYYEFLESKGFKKEVEDLVLNQYLFWNEDLQMVAECAPSGGAIQFKPLAVRPDHPTDQVHQYKTFEQMPYPFMEWGKTALEIATWEAKAGGKIVDNYANIQGYQPDQTKEPWWVERSYMLNTNNVPATYTHSIMLFSSIDYGFFPTTNTRYVLTNEFKALLAASGFVFDRTMAPGTSTEYNVYYNDNLKVALAPQVMGFASESFMPRFCITFSPQAAPTAAGRAGKPVASVMMVKESESPR